VRVKMFKDNILLFLVIVFLLFFSFSKNTLAGEVNFSQAILPVRFVYLNKDNIENIFNTAGSWDSVYVVKFINQEEKKEIVPTEKNFTDYQNFVCRRNVEFGVLKDNISYSLKNKTDFVDFKIDFVRKGSQLEEIHTLV
jgi:hypothetical protein